jgi:hypothetical protein
MGSSAVEGRSSSASFKSVEANAAGGHPVQLIDELGGQPASRSDIPSIAANDAPKNPQDASETGSLVNPHPAEEQAAGSVQSPFVTLSPVPATSEYGGAPPVPERPSVPELRSDGDLEQAQHDDGRSVPGPEIGTEESVADEAAAPAALREELAKVQAEISRRQELSRLAHPGRDTGLQFVGRPEWTAVLPLWLDLRLGGAPDILAQSSLETSGLGLNTVRPTPEVLPERGLDLPGAGDTLNKERTSSDIAPAVPGSREPPTVETGLPQNPDDLAGAQLERIRALLDQGDIAGARLVLQRAVEKGSARAAFLLAELYDPDLLNARYPRASVRAEPHRARELYVAADAGGVAEARARLNLIK